MGGTGAPKAASAALGRTVTRGERGTSVCASAGITTRLCQRTCWQLGRRLRLSGQGVAIVFSATQKLPQDCCSTTATSKQLGRAQDVHHIRHQQQTRALWNE